MRALLTAATLPFTDGLVLRLNADEGVSTIGNTVTAWEDLSGQGNDVVTTDGAPQFASAVINGRNAVQFDGASDIMARDGISGFPQNAEARSVFMVASYDRARAGGFAYGNPVDNQGFGVQLAVSGHYAVDGWGTDNEFRSGAVGQRFGWVMQSAVYDGTDLTHYINGEPIDSRTHTFETVANSIRVGSDIAKFNRADINISEILVFDRALSENERIELENYVYDTYLPHRKGFIAETVTNATQPIALEFLPDDRLLIVEKPGKILLTDPSSIPSATSTYLELSNVDDQDERGLLDVELDPNFASNGYIYALYTNSVSTRLRVSRFTHLGNTANENSEVVIWESPQDYASCCHYGGQIVFGSDGKLYVSVGDEFDGDNAQDLSQPLGKIIRVNPDGTIPTDNPFINDPNALDEIYAYGLRNPFRMTYDAVHDQILVSEVGGNVQSSAWEDIHRVERGANYGWPDCEGECVDPSFTDPIFTYPHQFFGASVMGGFTHDGTNLPDSYDGTYFFGDYVRSWIRILELDSNGDVAADRAFSATGGGITSLAQGPDGSIYYTDIFRGEVRRQVFIGDVSPPPVITQASANPSDGSAPLTVQFTGMAEGSGGAIQYRWVFGDGQQAFQANPSHTYASDGTYSAQLFATDSNGTTASPVIEINVGAPPVVSITEPDAGYLFRAGETINYSADATDPDGDDSLITYAWTLDFIHNNHTHPGFNDVPGQSGSFDIPTSGHDFSDQTGYRLSVEVTDENGLTDTDVVEIYPDKVDITIDSSPSGIPIDLDTVPVATPRIHDTLIGFEHVLNAPPTYCIVGIEHSFQDWSNGGTNPQTIIVTDQPANYTANYVPTGICGPGDPGDGFVPQPGADLAGRAGPNWWVGVSSGIDATNEKWGSWSTTANWMDVQVADVDNDGIDDIVGRAGNGKWWVARSNGTGFNNELWGSWSTAANWQYVQVGDFNNDGLDDIAGFTNGKWWVARSTGTEFISERWGRWTPSNGWQDVHVADVDGDGRDDIVGRGANGVWTVAKSDGSAFNNEVWGSWSATANWVNVSPADVNNDGRDDLVGRVNGKWWVALSSNNQFNNQLWGQWSNGNWQDVQVADVDGDGFDDITGRLNGQWWVAVSTGSQFNSDVWGQWNPNANWVDVQVADLNNDGRHDIVGRVNGNWWAALSTGASFFNRLWTRWSANANWQDVLVGNFAPASASLQNLLGEASGEAPIGPHDIDNLCRAVRLTADDLRYDVNNDQRVDIEDYDTLVDTVMGSLTVRGDANFDNRFDTEDFVEVFQRGHYETGNDNVGWSDGDWNCDGEFNVEDIVVAFQRGGFTP